MTDRMILRWFVCFYKCGLKFVGYSSYKTYEWGTIRRTPHPFSLLSITNMCKLPNDIGAFEETMVNCESQLRVRPFNSFNLAIISFFMCSWAFLMINFLIRIWVTSFSLRSNSFLLSRLAYLEVIQRVIWFFIPI